MTIECRVALSPTPAFINRTLLLAASVREFYPDAWITAYVGCSQPPPMAAAKELARCDISIMWVGGKTFDAWAGTRSPYLATMNTRWEKASDADHVLIMDADVICTGRFDELLAVDAVQGVMTHVPPMPLAGMRGLWKQFTGSYDYPHYLHSGAGIMCGHADAGFWYVNSGMCLLPRDHFERMIEPYHDAIAFMRATMSDTYWFDQLALGLAAAKADVPRLVLPIRYNFPNQIAFDQAYPVDLADCRFLHYLRTDTVDRDADFESVAAIQRFISRPGLTGSNALLQKRVGQLLNKVWPAATYSAEDAPYA